MRVDSVEFHPAYHALMRRSVVAGLHASVWDAADGEGAVRTVARAARLFMTAQAECGHLCPMTMTSASVAALAHAPELAERWLPVIRSRQYDSSARPLAEKSGATIGMGMTEKQGGSDVSATTTRAEDSRDGLYRITGHKWFMSAPMWDAFLVLAQAEEGLSCFLMPRFLPDGNRNAIRLIRLKDKLGNRSNASAEVGVRRRRGVAGRRAGRRHPDHHRHGHADPARLRRRLRRPDADGARRGGPPRAPSQGLRRASDRPAADAARARRHGARCRRRRGARLPARRILRRAGNDPSEAAFARLMTPAVKYWVSKMAPSMIDEAMECLGGNGYVEESRLPRLYREAPVNAIWEGSGNIMAST